MTPVPPEIKIAPRGVAHASNTLLVLLTSVPPEALEVTLDNLSHSFAGVEVLVASSGTPDIATSELGERFPNLRFVPDKLTAEAAGGWVLTAADFLNIYKIAEHHGAGGCLLLGSESKSLGAESLTRMAAALASGADLVLPRYDAGPLEGLVNSALLYPVSRAIFGAKPRFPLAIDLALSIRMASRMATVAQKFTALNQNDAMMWPVAEAAVAGFSSVEVEAGVRKMPPPAVEDLNTLLGQIAASLFTEVDTHAAYWQRARLTAPPMKNADIGRHSLDASPNVQPMIESFQIAYRNLHEIWSLVLPPNSLLGLKRLSQMSAAEFRMGDSLWARTVYDFILAFRLRTINRRHLLGALTPLYLAWVASHILLAEAGGNPERHVEEVALAFETDKAYLVSRWRWPDRFNP